MDARFTLVVIFLFFICSPESVFSGEPRELVAAEAVNADSGVDGQRLAELLEANKELMGRRRVVRIDESALNTDHRFIPSEKGEEFDWCIGERVMVTLFGNETIVLKNRFVDVHEPTDNFSDYWSWAGYVDGDDASSAVFIMADHRIARGSINSSIVGYYRILHINDSFYLVYELDQHLMREKARPFDDIGRPPEPKSSSGNQDFVNDSLIQSQSSGAGGGGSITVNAFATEQFPGGPSGASLDLNEGVTLANAALAGSAKN